MGAERRDGLATQQVVARRRRNSMGLRCRCGTRSAFGAGGVPWSRPVCMPGCGARSTFGVSGTPEHERRDEAVGGVRSALGASGMPWSRPVRMPGCGVRSALGAGGTLCSVGLRRGQSLWMRPCFIQRPFSTFRFCRLRCWCLVSPSSGPFCRKTAPNLTSPLNFWAVFEGLFCAEFF